ncbi:MAG: dTDP-4-dehydrorhamnose reductase, partial [Geminicoccales bacterium]
MNVLVLGSSGQLAQHLREVLQGAMFWGRRECSLEDPAGAEAAILKAAPAAIVNAAAYTAVDKAEDEPEVAWRVNADGAAAAARAAATLDIPLIHISTDYVFDGDSERPYQESDPPRPINVYGKTKLAGEMAVASLCPRHWILRASWVFSEYDGNFVTTMLRLANERDRLRVVTDQHGRPTYAGDLARVIASLLTGQNQQAVPCGIHHVSGGDATSWHHFAERIIARAHEEGLVKRPPLVEAIPTADYPSRARRPMNSILQPSAALQRTLRLELDWKAGLDEVLTRLRSGKRGTAVSGSAEATPLSGPLGTVGLQRQLRNIGRGARIRHAKRLHALRRALRLELGWKAGLDEVLTRLRSGKRSTDLGGSAKATAFSSALGTVGLQPQLRNIGRDARIRHAKRLGALVIALGDPIVTAHEGGIIVRGVGLPPSKAPPLLFRGGAYTNEQEIVAHSRIVRLAEARCVVGPIPTLPPRPVRHVSTRVLYGGFVFEHFGHLLLEGLARLWGPRLVDSKLPIYVQCAKPTLPASALKLFDLAGLAKRVHVVREDTSFDSVVVPAPAFVIQHKAHRVFKEMYLRITDRALGSSQVDTTDQPLYLSRTRLPSTVRALMGESILEDVLRRNGVHVIHPEQLDLIEQIRLVNRHRIVLG